MFEPKFIITNLLLKNISRIDASREIIENSALIPSWERKFKDDAVVRIVHYSTHIENNPLSYTQVDGILSGNVKRDDVRIRDYNEIINYRGALEFMDNDLKIDDASTISTDTLLKIHKILTKGIIPVNMCGQLRDVPVVLINSGTREVSYRAPESDKVEKMLEDLFSWYNSSDGNEVHPVIRAGILHTQIARIHPFVEANGRTARTMATLSLYKDSYDIRKFFCLDEHYDRDLARYYSALQDVERGNGDMTGWLEYFSAGLAEELGLIKEKVLEISRDMRLKKKVGQLMLTDRQLKIVSFVEKNGYIDNKHWRDLFRNISDDTVLRDLKGLMSTGLIKKTGSTKSAKYILKG